MEKEWRRIRELRLRNFPGSIAGRCSHAQDGPPQCSQGDSMIPIVNQRPMCGAVITQPVVLYTPLLLPGANKRRHRSFSRFVHAVRLDQKQLAISEPKEGFATLGIGATAEHILTASCSAKNNLGEPLDSELLALRMPQGFPGRRLGSRITKGGSNRS